MLGIHSVMLAWRELTPSTRLRSKIGYHAIQCHYQELEMNSKQTKTNRITKKKISTILVYAALLVGSCVMMLPFLWMISTALKSADKVMVFPPEWIPQPVVWKNFVDGWTTLPFTLYLKNTCIITTSVLLGTLFTSSLAGYSFARLRFPGKNLLFILTLATMMLPAQVTMIPVFLMFRDFGWLNTFMPLTIGAWLGGGAFSIFLMRQFILGIPVELDEAARIDGMGAFGIYRFIILPLIKPCLAVVAVFTFIGTWNDFMGPMIYLTTPDKMTLALGLQFFQGHYGVTLHLLMAVSLVVMAPCLILFLLAQEQFISGVTMTGIKG